MGSTWSPDARGQERRVRELSMVLLGPWAQNAGPAVIQLHCPGVATVLWMTKHGASTLGGTVIHPRGIRMEAQFAL